MTKKITCNCCKHWEWDTDGGFCLLLRESRSGDNSCYLSEEEVEEETPTIPIDKLRNILYGHLFSADADAIMAVVEEYVSNQQD